MLVLGRKDGEVLRIGDDIRILILSISRYQVRIGIDAPKDIKIRREEVFLRIKQELEKHQKNTGDE